MPIIEVENVIYEYTHYDETEFMAINGVSFTVEKGEFIAIIGHNGSGKSTLAKLLNGLIVPKSGKILINGLDTKVEENKWSIRQSAGLVFQNPDNQLVAAIVEEDVAFGPENLGVSPPEIRKRVDESLSAVRMSEFAKFEPHKLSGGQKQRIAIAGIMAMRPDILILDEPTAMLDPMGRSEVMETLVRLNKEEGMTVVLITHFMEEAMAADRILVMNDGKIELTGTPAEVFSHVDELRKIGLDIPAVVELAHLLRKAGMDIPPKIMDTDMLVEEICRLI
ncbi:MAG TPA: energy-coupling factor transporter ATPase [Clostridia bacterium]|nr:energy-coupling factor transporter ATPase [Clostridia bacterium]